MSADRSGRQLGSESGVESATPAAQPPRSPLPSSDASPTALGGAADQPLSGWLYKAEASGGQAKRRWFVLKGSSLAYYHAPSDRTPRRTLLMKGVTVGTPAPTGLASSPVSGRFTIQIKQKAEFGAMPRVYKLEAESEADFELWMAALTNAATRWEAMAPLGVVRKGGIDPLGVVREGGMAPTPSRGREASLVTEMWGVGLTTGLHMQASDKARDDCAQGEPPSVGEHATGQGCAERGNRLPREFFSRDRAAGDV